MPFTTLTAEGPLHHEDDLCSSWVVLVDGRRVTRSTMAIDHAHDPMSVDHHCAPDIDCSFKRLVRVRRVGRVIAWLPPPPPRVPGNPGPRALEEVEDEPLWIADASYAAWLASLGLDPEAEMAQVRELTDRETDAILWAAVRAELGLGEAWPIEDVWAPPWEELWRERVWQDVQPSEHPLAPALLDAAARPTPRVRLLEVTPALAANACLLTEGFGADGCNLCSRMAATEEAEGPALWHGVGRGCWARFRFA